jgi:hypothetical protein
VYNLDLAPSDDLLFFHLKKFLAGQSLRSDRQTEDVVQEWLQGSAEVFFDKGMQKLVPYVTCSLMYRDADKFLARPGRKQAIATEDFEFHVSYL